MTTLLIGGLGPGELVLILLIVMIIFGAGQLPSVGDALGKGIRNFKSAASGKEDIDVAPKAQSASLPPASPKVPVADAEEVASTTEP